MELRVPTYRVRPQTRRATPNATRESPSQETRPSNSRHSTLEAANAARKKRMSSAPYFTKRDRFKSSLSGREYPFANDFDGTSRRAALAQLEADDRRIMAANDDRALRILARPLSTREHLYG